MNSVLWQSLKHEDLHAKLPLSIVEGEGCLVFDAEGKAYINAFSGLSLPFGLKRQELLDAVSQQVASLPYLALDCVVPKVTENYAERLSAFVPGGPWHVLFTNSGSEAVDSAIKAADLYWIAKTGQKKGLLSFSHAYHGQTIGAMAISGAYSKLRTFELQSVYFAESPLCEACVYNAEPASCALPCLDRVNQLLAKGEVNSIIIEPIMAAGGVHVPPQAYWRRLAELIKRYNTFLIVDESATGAGRTGKKFAFESLPIQPDIVLLAKGINGGYLPIGITLMAEHLSKTLLADDATLFSTSQGGNATVCALGLAALDLFEKEQPWKNAAVQGNYLMNALKALQNSKSIAMRVRGEGLLIGIEFEGSYSSSKPIAEAMRDKMRAHGVLVYGRGNFMAVFPPLSVDKNTIDELIKSFCLSCDEYTKENDYCQSVVA